MRTHFCSLIHLVDVLRLFSSIVIFLCRTRMYFFINIIALFTPLPILPTLGLEVYKLLLQL